MLALVDGSAALSRKVFLHQRATDRQVVSSTSNNSQQKTLPAQVSFLYFVSAIESSWPSLLGHELLNRSIQINRESCPCTSCTLQFLDLHPKVRIHAQSHLLPLISFDFIADNHRVAT